MSKEKKAVKKEKKESKPKSPKTKAKAPSPTPNENKAAYPPYDIQAAEYMFQQRPGTYSLIHFIGEQVSQEIAQILRRSITLPEAEHMVSLDGEPTTCASEGVEFQPVKYLPFVPRGLKERIAKGEALVDIQLPLGGAFYLTKDGKAIAYSGSVFRYNARRQRYEWASNSPLVIIADEIGKRYGQRQWGVPFVEVDNILNAKAVGAERRKKIGQMVANIAPIRRGLGRMNDAFENAGRIGKRNGKPKNGQYNRAEAKRQELATDE